MKILVAGSGSFIGYSLSKRLIELGHKVIGIDYLENDFVDNFKVLRNNELKEFKDYELIKMPKHNEGLNSLLDGEKIDYVYDFYSKDFIYDFGEKPNYSEFLETNVVGAAKIFELAVKLKAKKFFCGSTHSVYGKARKKKLTEKKVIPKPISPHGASKLAEENVVEFLSNFYGLNAIIFRFFMVYGPYMNPFTVTYKFMEHLKRGDTKLIMENNPLSTRDFIYITDAVNFIISAMDKRIKYQTINIASGETHTMIDLAKTIAKNMGKDPDLITVGESRKSFSKLIVEQQQADISRAIKMLKYKPQVSFDEGIRNTVEWYEKGEFYKNLYHP
jgi:UDP-glucuronate 4-epimerase